MDQIEVAGLRIAYERVGAGPALVLLHGYVGDGPTLWRRQLEALCDEFTVVVWDAPGVGGSSDPPESFGAALPHINVATLLVCGGEDVRAPLTVAHDLEAAISALDPGAAKPVPDPTIPTGPGPRPGPDRHGSAADDGTRSPHSPGPAGACPPSPEPGPCAHPGDQRHRSIPSPFAATHR